LVIGLGNPLSGDDAFGTCVIDRLRRDFPDSVLRVDFVDAHCDLLGQIDRFATYDRVVLVDAILDPHAQTGHSGDVIVMAEKTMQSLPESSGSAHQLSPLLTVKLFRSLNPEAATEILLVGLCTDAAGLSLGQDNPRRLLNEESISTGTRKVHELI
jgi:hydrogenase maturation protease